jgi:hypothetical protein
VSDFLGRLAARTLGEGGAIRPRLPSLFEPAPPEGAHIPSEPEAPRTPPRLTKEDESTIVARHELEEATARVSPSAEPHAAEALPLPASARPEHEPVDPSRRSIRPPEAPAARKARPTPTLTLAEGRRERTPPAAPLGASVEPPPDRTPRVDAPVPDRRLHVPRVTTSGHAEEPRVSAVTGPARHAEPPVVHVTIGRIEVRAITPKEAPAPSAPSPRSEPTLSLDEYLKRRAGGRP